MRRHRWRPDGFSEFHTHVQTLATQLLYIRSRYNSNIVDLNTRQFTQKEQQHTDRLIRLSVICRGLIGALNWEGTIGPGRITAIVPLLRGLRNSLNKFNSWVFFQCMGNTFLGPTKQATLTTTEAARELIKLWPLHGAAQPTFCWRLDQQHCLSATGLPGDGSCCEVIYP